MDVKHKVLVVDDDDSIRELIHLYLEEDYQVIEATTGLEAVEKVKREKPSLILLDIMLPHKNGWEVCQEIRSFSPIPIIMVSAKGEEQDKILGLELGAEDYIAKPFSPRELLARVKAQIRRSLMTDQAPGGVSPEGKVLNYRELSIYLTNRKVILDQAELELTAKEFDLLVFLAQHEGQVFNREQLLDQVWGMDYMGDSRAVDSAVKRLRKKLNDEQNKVKYIHTVWGIGYKFEGPS